MKRQVISQNEVDGCTTGIPDMYVFDWIQGTRNESVYRNEHSERPQHFRYWSEQRTSRRNIHIADLEFRCQGGRDGSTIGWLWQRLLNRGSSSKRRRRFPIYDFSAEEFCQNGFVYFHQRPNALGNIRARLSFLYSIFAANEALLPLRNRFCQKLCVSRGSETG